MKKLLLASAVAALSITAAQAAPTVYGKVFLTLDVKDGDNHSTNANSRSQLNSNASRLGVKGSEALTANTDLVYQLEYRLDTDADDNRNWESRDTYLGLAHKQYGTAVAGRLTAIDDYINYAKVVAGGVVGGDDVLATFTGPRANNAFAYFSPNFQGAQVMAMYAMDETKNAVSTNESLLRDAWGLGVKYEPTTLPVKAGITYIQAGATDTNAATFDYALRVSGAYAINPAITLAAQYQLTEGYAVDSGVKQTAAGKQKEQTYTVSGSYKVGQTPWTTYAQVDIVDNAAYKKDAERQRLAVGGKYAFNQNTTGHLYGAYMKSKNIDIVSTSTETKADSYGIGAGIEYKF